jgi:hypothetical protein
VLTNVTLLVHPEECDQLKELASSRLRRSGVSNSITGADEYSEIRTSSGMFFSRGETPLIKQIEDRVAAWTLLPPLHAEGMQILKYEVWVGLARIRRGSVLMGLVRDLGLRDARALARAIQQERFSANGFGAGFRA